MMPPRKKCLQKKQTETVNVDDIVPGRIQVGLVRTFVRWLLTQGPLVMGIYLGIGLSVWSFFWIVEYKIPEHTAQAHKSKEDLFKKIEEIAKANNEAQDREIKQTTTAIKHLGDTFDKSMDRFDRFIRDVSKLPPIPKRVEESQKSKDGGK